MRRGTRVANAYVAVTADGSGINKEIVDAVEDAGPDVEKAGDEHGENYGNRFSEGFLERMRSRMPKITAALSSRMGRAGEDAGEEAGDSFVKRMAAKGKDAADKISDGISDRLASNPEGVRRGIERAFDDDFADRIATRFADQMAETMGDRLELLMAKHQQFLEEQAEVSGNKGPRKPRTPTDTGTDWAGLLGGLFGRGSRNNFLNLLGGIVSKATGLVTGLAKQVGSLGSTFKTGFTSAAEGASFLQKSLSGLDAVGSSIGSSLAKSAPAVLAFMAIITVVVIPTMSILVSLAGGLLGILTALASTVASALVGAFAVGGAAMGAAAVAAGLLTTAFMSMTDAQREMLSSAFQPLKAEMVGLGQIMLAQMVPAFSTWSSNLQRALSLVLPLAQRMGTAFAQAGNTITAALSGPGFQRLAQALATFLPGIVTRLSTALGGFLNGLAGLFSALLPYVFQFADYLTRVADRFSRWANSAQGQNEIKDFIDRALNSLRSFWDFLKEVGGLLSDVLFNPTGQQAGNSMFDGMTRAIGRVRRAIADGSLEKWFRDAMDLAEGVGEAIVGLSDIMVALYDSGVVQGLADYFRVLAGWWDIMGDLITPLVNHFGTLAGAIERLAGPIETIANMAQDLAIQLGGLLNLGPSGGWKSASIPFDDLFNGASINPNLGFIGPTIPSGVNLDDLINMGNSALNQTSQQFGGYLSDQWQNPYEQWANSLIDGGPGVMATLRKAFRELNKQIADTLRDLARSLSAGDVREGIKALQENIRTTAENLVNTAQDALNSAASSLASATTPQDAAKALRQVRAAQAALNEALRQQRKTERVIDLLRDQKQVKRGRVNRLLEGLRVENATLADFAVARGIVARQLERANQKLSDAINTRNSYETAVTDSIKAFGALTTASAKVIDGVEQALTATDITTNLQERLDKITKFRDNLRLLAAQGLSNAAYQQIVDMGVDGGSAYADALLQGGLGAIQDTNSLVGQINSLAEQMGLDISRRLYQSGVDAARGLVDGLESLSEQLDRAATRLGNSIARAVKRALGIHSPSRVMLAQMDSVGDGIEGGLDRQHRKVTNAADRLSRQISVSPEVVATYASRQHQPVSGNEGDGKRFRDLIVQTPTEDPIAVAHEVLNEVTGRLP